MCRPARCRSCGKTTWAGCGHHVDQVLAGVPRQDRCTCDTEDGGSASAGSSSQRPSLWQRLTGR